MNTSPWRVPPVLWWLLAAAAWLWLLHLLGPILMPFVLGAAMAYVGDPIVDRLEGRYVSRTLGVALVFLLFGLLGLGLTLVLVPLLFDQVAEALKRIPVLLDWVQNQALPALGLELPDGAKLDSQGVRDLLLKNWQTLSGSAQELLAPLSRSGAEVLAVGLNLVMVPVVTFYLLRDWDVLVALIGRYLPRRQEPMIRRFFLDADQVLGSFIRGQLLVMAALGTIYTLGLWALGLNLALLVGLSAGLLSFVPYLGTFLGVVMALIAMLLQDPGLLPLLGVGAVFAVGQVLEGAVLTPWLVGDRIGLHPVAVIFAVMAGGQLFGFLGVLLALPAAAVLAVGVRRASAMWLASAAYRGEA